jgi:hypothetical protein
MKSSGGHWVELGVLGLLAALAAPLACGGSTQQVAGENGGQAGSASGSSSGGRSGSGGAGQYPWCADPTRPCSVDGGAYTQGGGGAFPVDGSGFVDGYLIDGSGFVDAYPIDGEGFVDGAPDGPGGAGGESSVGGASG